MHAVILAQGLFEMFGSELALVPQVLKIPHAVWA
jgi:hypothetical protein